MVSSDTFVMALALLSFVALAVGAILRYFRQPSVIAYIITGLILGPFCLKIVTDTDLITNVGSIGVVFLLFFIGISISPSELVTRWRIAILGTLFQVILSVLIIFPLGAILDWSLGKVILLGFVISLSSTAVVVKILEARKELYTNVGQDVLSILIVQDLAVIPMIIVLSLMNGQGINTGILTMQIIGCALALIFVLWIMRQKEVMLPFSQRLKEDPEMQILSALVLSLGIASLSGFFHLSAALGAFLAGIFIASTRETRWVQQSLEPFKVLFIALFFISIGMLINLDFFWQKDFFLPNIAWVLLLCFLILFINSFLNAIIFKFNGESWRTSFYAGALLAQIGEFSFVLATIGMENSLLSAFGYQLIIQVIALSLIISPIWINIFLRFVDQSEIIIRNTKKMAEKHPGYIYHPPISGQKNTPPSVSRKNPPKK